MPVAAFFVRYCLPPAVRPEHIVVDVRILYASTENALVSLDGDDAGDRFTTSGEKHFLPLTYPLKDL